MKLLLVAINAKYIHSNPAVYSLRACAGDYKEQIEIAEYTINHREEDILADIYKRKPDVVAFSCYIWNIGYVRSIMEDLHKILKDVPIWAGGPEVSYDAASLLQECGYIKGIMTGEGEQSFALLAAHYIEGKGRLDEINGLVYRDEHQGVVENPPSELMDLDQIPFLYECLEDFENRIIYYESSRGCPFSCSYCLSSIDKSVRFRSVDIVKRELQFFLERKVPQVKFVDRTFNCNHRHAFEIWKYIKEHDNGITNFHFEISADLLKEEELILLNRLRPGLIQLEIGVQSVNQHTIHEIDRKMDLEELAATVKRIHLGENIHQHLDLIAGLPKEDLESFQHSFNSVYALAPHQLQLGFLKVLKGSKMHRKAAEYGLVYHHGPPYEVLFTKWLDFDEVRVLKAIEEMVEVYYNSGQFAYTLKHLVKEFATPYQMYERLAKYYEEKGLSERNHSRMSRFQILYDFIIGMSTGKESLYRELLTLDLYLRENSKSRPAWAIDQTPYKEAVSEVYKKEKAEHTILQGYDEYTYRQLLNMTHWEVFQEDVTGSGKKEDVLVIFDYKKRDALTGNASINILEYTDAEKRQG